MVGNGTEPARRFAGVASVAVVAAVFRGFPGDFNDGVASYEFYDCTPFSKISVPAATTAMTARSGPNGLKTEAGRPLCGRGASAARARATPSAQEPSR